MLHCGSQHEMYVLPDIGDMVLADSFWNLEHVVFSVSVIKSAATLVICPASLVHQWQKEIERRVERGLFRVIVYHGANREANSLRSVVINLQQRYYILSQTMSDS